jgi:hypothetical protein
LLLLLVLRLIMLSKQQLKGRNDVGEARQVGQVD